MKTISLEQWNYATWYARSKVLAGLKSHSITFRTKEGITIELIQHGFGDYEITNKKSRAFVKNFDVALDLIENLHRLSKKSARVA